MSDEFYTNNERLAYGKGFNIGFWVGAVTSFFLTLGAGVLIGAYVPLP